MTSKVSLDALMSKWQEIHGDLDAFQKDLFVEHVAIQEIQNFALGEIQKAFQITPKLNKVLVLLNLHDNLDEYIPDIDFLSDDMAGFVGLEGEETYEYVASVEPAEDDILGQELAHDEPAGTVRLWI
jgi:hypothetical protein